MNRMDTCSPSAAGGWKRWIIGAVPAAAIVAAVLVFRSTNPPAQAQAQAPIKNGPNRSAPTKPAASAPAGTPARPAASTGTAPVRSAPAVGSTTSAKGSTKAPPPINTLSVMAVVNGEQITRTELGRECLRRYGTEVLDNLVNKQLLSEACTAQNIQITEKDVNDEIERIAGKFGLPADRWMAMLREERGFTAEQYKREVVWPMLALRRASQMSVQVTKDEVKQAFESEYGAKVRCRLIIVGKQDQAEKILATVKANPKAFEDQARKHCEDPGVASASGVIPPIAMHTGDPAIEEAAFGLQKGQISNIIPVKGNKFVILKCEDHIPEQYISSKDLPAVQSRLEDRIRESKTRYAASQFFAEIHKKAQIINTLAQPARKKEVPAGAAALVNGRQITIQQLQDECLIRFGSDVLDGEINRKLFLQELARRKVEIGEKDIQAEIARAADTNGYLKDGKPDVERWIKDITTQDGATVDLYRSDVVWPTVALKKLCASRVSVSELDLQKGFESNYGERVKVLAVVLGDQRQAQRVWDMARNNPTDVYFSQLAQQYSVEPASRANGGEVPPICKHSGSPIIEKAAFELKEGELSGVIAIEDQFIILRCQGRTEPVQRELAAVKDELYKDIFEKKMRTEMNREYERLRESAQIDNFLAGTSQAPKPKTAGPSASTVRPALDAGGAVSPASATFPRTSAPAKR